MHIYIGTTLPSLKAQLAFRGSRSECLCACVCMFYKGFDLTWASVALMTSHLLTFL